MEQSMAKAAVLIEALPYIQRFRGAIVVVKFGGSAMEQQAVYEGILTDVAFMECVGMKPVIVHGGGSEVTLRMQEAGIPARFVEGMRVTGPDAIEIVDRVLAEEVSPGIVRTLQGKGAQAVGIRGSDVLRATQHRPWNREKTERLDLGLVGRITSVDTSPIEEAIGRDAVPVISPLGRGEDGQLYNINADLAAAEVAIALSARKLVFLSDVHGVLKDAEDPDSILTHLRGEEIEDLIRSGVIVGGMVPKVNSGVRALHSGVDKVHIIDGRMNHSLLLEIFTRKGVGTEIGNQ